MPDYKVAFWNVENLFGPEDHPHRLEWIKRKIQSDLKGWSHALYSKKLGQLAKIIAAVDPDILAVCEVEDAHVLQDLVAAVGPHLPHRTYAVIHTDSEKDKRGIDTAFLFDTTHFTVNPALVFNHFVIRRTGTRDILQATFTSVAHAQDLVILVNHWPSRSGGAEQSAGFRAAAAETLGYWHERIREETGDDTAVLALGDLNDDPWDPSVMFNANATREKGDVRRAKSAKFYNFAWEYMEVEAEDHQGGKRLINGTLYYNNDGNLFDQILASPTLVKSRGVPFRVLDGTARIELVPDMVDHRTGQGPRRFGLPKGDVSKVDVTGYSDHFPVSVMIRETAMGA